MRFSISRRRSADPSYGITTADSSHLSDISRRQRQYVVTMLFRIVAILVVVLVPGLSLLVRAILGLVATIIPYVAVIRANGGPEQSEAPTNLMIGTPRQSELPGPDRSLGGTRRIDADGEPIDADEPFGPESGPAQGEDDHSGGERRGWIEAEWVEAGSGERGETDSEVRESADS